MTSNRVFTALLAATLALAGSFTASAVTYNLNTLKTVPIDTVDGRAYFTTDFTKTTGTGVFNPFLSLQNTGEESGFNISTGVLNTKQEGQYTRTQRVSDLQTVVVNGSSYYSFLLDVNESNSTSGSKISIDSIKIYTSNSLLTSFSSLQSSGILQFNIDSSQDHTLLYDDFNSGSGQGDVAFFIPTSALAGVASNDYFYLYEKLGDTGGVFSTDSGYEKTANAPNLTFVPIPETNALVPILAVLGVVVAGPFIRRCFNP